MARGKYKCGGAGRDGRPKSGICTLCGRPHPKGKQQRAKARDSGWESCASVAMRRKLSQSSNKRSVLLAQ